METGNLDCIKKHSFGEAVSLSDQNLSGFVQILPEKLQTRGQNCRFSPLKTIRLKEQQSGNCEQTSWLPLGTKVDCPADCRHTRMGRTPESMESTREITLKVGRRETQCDERGPMVILSTKCTIQAIRE